MTIAAAFAEQAAACQALGSPLNARVLSVLAARLEPGTPLTDRLFAWPGDISHRGASVALRLAGGLHALVLSGGDADLAAAYADPAALDDAALWRILSATMAAHRDHLLHWLDSRPQTNEVRRSAVLIAAGRWLAARFGLPLVLSELGASAGLNLLWDRYALDLPGRTLGPADAPVTLNPGWEGRHPERAAPMIADRAGVDLNPLDPVRDRQRILSYIWPDQHDRLARTRAALDLAAGFHGHLARADAADWLGPRLSQRRQGATHMVFHTLAWQYFPRATQQRCDAALAQAGAGATPDAPLAHFGMEADPVGQGTRLTLRLWPGGTTIDMGTADPHARWVRWFPPDPTEIPPQPGAA